MDAEGGNEEEVDVGHEDALLNDAPSRIP